MKHKYKVGQVVKFTDTGTYWRDSRLHVRIGKIIHLNFDGYCIEWTAKTGKVHISNIGLEDDVCKIIEVIKDGISN